MPELNTKSPRLPDFSTKIRHEGTSKQAKYFVEMGIPNVVANNYDAQDIELINLYAEQAMFPEFVIMTQQNRAFNNPIEMPYDRAFGPITMTFLCDRQMTVKHFFDMWTQGIYSSFGGVLNYYDDYIVPELNIYKIDEQHSKVYCVTLYNAYAKVVNDIVLAANSTDLARFQVVFTYEMWRSFVIESDGYDIAAEMLMAPLREIRRVDPAAMPVGPFQEIMGPSADLAGRQGPIRNLPTTHGSSARRAAGANEFVGPPSDLAGSSGGILGGITSSIENSISAVTNTIDRVSNNIISSLPDIPGIDFLNNTLGTAIPGSVGGIMKTMGISTGLDLVSKMRNPKMFRDSMKRAARNVGSEIIRGPKAQVLSKLPRSIRQIGGSIGSKALGRFGL